MASAQVNMRVGGYTAKGGIGLNANAYGSPVQAKANLNAGASAKTAARIDSTISTVRNGTDKDSGNNFSPNQDYAKLKADLTRRRVLFEDTEFPASDKSLCFSSSFIPSIASALGLPNARVEWKRPKDILKGGVPQFIVGGASRFDIDQGALGDCWFLASIGALCMHPELFGRVVDASQNDNFAIGLFHFRFWHFGEWVDVCVDDRLPTVNGQLVFLQSRESKNEFWSALFEKAYAKVNGSYEALKGGSECEAMEDFTGGISYMYELRAKTPPGFFDALVKANNMSSLLGCSIDGDLSNPVLPNGLVVGHAYTITDVRYVDVRQGSRMVRVPLIRVRNPWGDATEWKGAWSDGSAEWNAVPPEERQKMGLTKEPNGEWWMSFNDWINNFDGCTVCYLGPDSLDDDCLSGAHRERWNQVTIHGEWVQRVSAGGCANNRDTFWTNPQFHFTVPQVKQQPGTQPEPNVCLGLMQVDRRALRAQGLDFLTIGFVVYKLTGKEPPGPLPASFFRQPWFAPKPTPTFINSREVVHRETLPPGEYLLVPSTFEANVPGKFVVRIYTEFQVNAGSKDESTAINVAPTPNQPVTGKAQVPNANNPAPGVPVAPQLPANEVAKLDGAIKDLFTRLAEAEGDENGEIDAWTLQKVLNSTFKKVLEFPFDGFSIEASRSLIALLDVDQNGKLGFPAFKKLWCELRIFKAVFVALDDTKRGLLNSQQLRQAFRMLGFTVSNGAFHAIVMRYCDIRQGNIHFDDYVLCTARLRTALENFQSLTRDGKTANFNLDNFIQTMVYL